MSGRHVVSLPPSFHKPYSCLAGRFPANRHISHSWISNGVGASMKLLLAGTLFALPSNEALKLFGGHSAQKPSRAGRFLARRFSVLPHMGFRICRTVR